MIITPTQIRVTEDRRQDLLAATARARLVAAATRSSPSATPRPVGRIRFSLRQAVAALAAVVAVG